MTYRRVSVRAAAASLVALAFAAQAHAGAVDDVRPAADAQPPSAATVGVSDPAGPAQTGEAAAASPAAGEDIVVTARRQTERLQDVPVAVTAFAGASLAARAVDTLDQIAKYTPNIRFDGAAQLSGGNYNATVFIRGVGSNDFAIFSEPGVGFYVDDVFYARSIGGILDAVDIDSVQVLRGPQGTLFGKNTVGGAVLINTAKPELGVFSGRIEGTYGSFDRMDVKGAINVPLGEKVALRVSAATLNRDGYVTRLLDGDDMGNRNADMARVKLHAEPNDALTIDLGGDYTRARENSAPSKLLAVGNAAAGLAGVPFLVNYNRFVAPTRGIVSPSGSRIIDASWITDDPYTTWAGGGPNVNDLDLWGTQGTVAYDFGGATLKSITAYRHMDAFFARDGDNTPYVYRQTRNDDVQKQLSEELQLSGKAIDDRLTYVAGLFYFHEKARDFSFADLTIGLDPPLPPPFGPGSNARIFANNKSYAAYAQGSFAITPQLAVEVGGRYSSDRKKFSIDVFRQRDQALLITADRSATFKKFTPRLGVNYKPAEDVLLYGSYSKGFKQGGFNGRPLASAAEVTRYDPEVLDTYEAGIKSQWLDRKLTANLAVFHSIYNGIQLTVNQTPQNFIANAAKGKIDGFELELVARPARWFSVNGSVGHVNARYTSVGQGLGPTQILPITTASKFVKAPSWTATVGSEVSHDFGNGSNLALRGDLSLYSRIFHDVANTPIVTDDGYILANARIAYTLPGGNITLAAFGTNLTKSLYIISGNASPGFGMAEAAYGRPREWGASAGFKF